MIKTALAKVLTVKAAAVLAAVSAGGVALAATTGALPSPFDHTPAGAPTSAHATAKPTAGPAGANATPSPSLIGLCQAYLAGAGADHGKALDNPAFTALITAAGGRDKVDAYCASLPTSAAGNATNSHPSAPPATHPTVTHPTGAPTGPTCGQSSSAS